MSFLSEDTVKSLEGKFVKLQAGVTRRFKLLSHEKREESYGGAPAKMVDFLIVSDVETGDEKEVRANRSLMTALARLNSQLTTGSVIVVTPTLGTAFTGNDGREVTPLKYEVSLEASSM